MSVPEPDPRPAASGRPEPAVHVPLLHALERLRSRLVALPLPLRTSGVDGVRAERDAAVAQLDDYLLPRLRAHSAPLLVVVGGSTGAGKSTLVNSLLGEVVSAPGVLRPTTRSPVLVHHPLDARWFSTDRVLPALARTSSAAPAGVGRELRLVPSATLPQGLALLDAPDVDSVDVANRALAGELLAAADLWLFVTTAARYADAVPWELLRGAARRRARAALVVDRVDHGAEAVVDDLRRMMGREGLGDSPLFVVPETALVDGLLPEPAVAAVSRWLTDLGADAAARADVALATRDGVVDDLVSRARELAAAADAQRAADARLRERVRSAYADAAAHVRAATSDGALLRGEVLARWQDFVGTGDLFRSVEQGVGRLRDSLTGFFRGRPAVAPDAADEAAGRAHAAWRADPAGAALLGGLELSRASRGLRDEVDRQVRGWQADVLGLVREQGAGRRGTARYLSFGVNALGVSLMVLAFASTGGLTGVEVGIAGGTAVLAQKLLEAVFGDDAVRRLTVEARERLDVRVVSLLDGEAARFTGQLDALGAVQADGGPLREVVDDVVAAARAERTHRSPVPPGHAGDSRPLRGAGTVVDEAAPRPPRGFWRRLLGRDASA
jgi:energy-coupling factor transporter ATP-binding protein EcfA2